MTQKLRVFAAVGVGLVTVATANPATAQKAGGILRSYSIDSPASMSIHEEVTIYALRPAMGESWLARFLKFGKPSRTFSCYARTAKAKRAA